MFQHLVIVPDSLILTYHFLDVVNIAQWQNKIMERWRKSLQILKFCFLVLEFAWCGGMNKSGHQGVELFYKAGRNRMCGLVGERVSLGMALKCQKPVT